MPELDSYITLTEAAALLPGTPSHTSLWRWVRYGVKARNGQRIRLRHGRLGGRILTTRAWLDEFGEELALHDADAFPDPVDDIVDDMKGPSPKRRQIIPDPPHPNLSPRKSKPTKRRKTRKTKHGRSKAEALLDRHGI